MQRGRTARSRGRRGRLPPSNFKEASNDNMNKSDVVSFGNVDKPPPNIDIHPVCDSFLPLDVHIDPKIDALLKPVERSMSDYDVNGKHVQEFLLPQSELYYFVFEYLKCLLDLQNWISEILKLRLVDKRWKKEVEHDSLWKIVCKELFEEQVKDQAFQVFKYNIGTREHQTKKGAYYDAQIIRIMKNRRTETIQELFFAISSNFQKYKPNQKLMRKRLEYLIDRGYVQYDPDDRKKLNYIPYKC